MNVNNARIMTARSNSRCILASTRRVSRIITFAGLPVYHDRTNRSSSQHGASVVDSLLTVSGGESGNETANDGANEEDPDYTDDFVADSHDDGGGGFVFNEAMFDGVDHFYEEGTFSRGK
jgi:hypothetical protein